MTVPIVHYSKKSNDNLEKVTICHKSTQGQFPEALNIIIRFSILSNYMTQKDEALHKTFLPTVKISISDIFLSAFFGLITIHTILNES